MLGQDIVYGHCRSKYSISMDRVYHQYGSYVKERRITFLPGLIYKKISLKKKNNLLLML